MITIEHLEVHFDADRQRDEARFAELFARHTDVQASRRRRDADAEARASHERSIPEARGGW